MKILSEKLWLTVVKATGSIHCSCHSHDISQGSAAELLLLVTHGFILTQGQCLNMCPCAWMDMFGFKDLCTSRGWRRMAHWVDGGLQPHHLIKLENYC